MEPVGAIGGVRFVNDSKATNVEAARRSIESFDGGVVAIVGGRFKGGDFGELRDALAGRGRGGGRDRRGRAAGARRPWRAAAGGRAGSMREAVERGVRRWRRHDGVVLLAPACASFDWFRDYAERGRSFKEEVARLKARVEG